MGTALRNLRNTSKKVSKPMSRLRRLRPEPMSASAAPERPLWSQLDVSEGSEAVLDSREFPASPEAGPCSGHRA
jgi:hypothetical protein